MKIPQTFLTFLFITLSISLFAQREFIPPENDEISSNEYIYELKLNVKAIVKTLDKENKRDLKRYYKAKRTGSINLAEYEHFFFNEDWNNYLDNISDKITTNNPTYNFDNIQVVLSRYFWPNAFSIGEGTIVLNPGLISRLDNEDQLAFILCHEYAHFLLRHSEERYLSILEVMRSEELEKQIETIQDSRYYKTTQVKELLKSLLYESNRHVRENEIEADSLGFLLFKNSGYDIEAALTTMQTLDKLNDRFEYGFDIDKLTGIDRIEIEPSELLRGKHYEKGSWLEFDSIKSHPDCDVRFDILAKKTSIENAEFDHFETENSISEKFRRFRQEMHYFVIESYKTYHRTDLALLSVWELLHNGDQNEYLHKQEFYLITSLMHARKNHKIGRVCTYPNDSMSEAHNAITSIAFGMRYKHLIKKLYPLAMEAYDPSNDDEESYYYRALLAWCKGDEEDLKLQRAEYFTRFNRHTGDHYLEVRYLYL